MTSTIHIFTRPPTDPVGADLLNRKIVGAFVLDPETTPTWLHNHDAIRCLKSDCTDRVWLTTSGKWVAFLDRETFYLPPREARAWMLANRYHDTVREHFTHDGPGRPATGREVTVTLPEDVITRVEALATTNATTRGEQLRTLIIDHLDVLAASWRS